MSRVIHMHLVSRPCFSGLLLTLLFAGTCNANTQNQVPQQTATAERLASVDQVFRGDFEQIKQRGRLRIVVPANVGGGRYLPRKGSPVSQQFEIAQAFAQFHNLVPELVISESFADMIPLLVEGKGDIVVGNLTVTDARRKKIAFSIPLDHVREKVLVASSNDSINAVKDLNHKRVMVSPSSECRSSLRERNRARAAGDQQVRERAVWVKTGWPERNDSLFQSARRPQSLKR